MCVSRGREDHESELEQHPGSVLVSRRGPIEAEDADACGREEDDGHGEDAHDERGLADCGQGEQRRPGDRQEYHSPL